MHSESLITRGRNKMVIRFLEDESLTHLFWIDSDIASPPQQVCRLLLADRDVCAGVYPMKSINWPEGACRRERRAEQFEVRYGEYPYNRSITAKLSNTPTLTALSKWPRRRRASCASSAMCSIK